MKYSFFGYRNWSKGILDDLRKSHLEIDSYTIKKTEYSDISSSKILENPNNLEEINFKEYLICFFYGWSWKIPKEIVNNNDCICLHPSPLPKYRGGSPLQHQIINGETYSAVSLFKIGEGLDDGPIYYQEKFSLEGNLKDIFFRIRQIGSKLTLKVIKDYEKGLVCTRNQDESQATIYQRRKPEESELNLKRLKVMTSKQIHNFIRALQDPYPNAYIFGRDGKKVYLKESKIEMD